MTSAGPEILHTALLGVALLLFGACDTPRDAPEATDTPTTGCAPLALTIDGEPLQLEHALARYDEGSDVYIVSLFNTSAVRCADFVMPARFTQPGELEVRAAFADNGEHALSLGSHARIVPEIELAQPTEEPGEVLALCVTRQVELNPDAGPFKGHRITVSGRFEAPLCTPSE